ncbi:FecR domain-containing protein [Methylopila sp. 73B]|uniref:FecR family protein n=1 Tax=Methylopila sp. 73B TaxID=1120792 RepID=UPI00037604B2|nr:FecR domain-containing protein [Methylopila sp. 73B]
MRDEALAWFLKIQAQGEEAEVVRAFNAWCGADPAHAAAFAAIAELWSSPEIGGAALRFRKPPPARAPVNRRLVVAAAASFAAVAVLSALRAPELLVQIEADHVSGTGERSRVALSDGSLMTLDAASAVAVDFSGDRRSVRLLKGAAFFDVRADPARPFRVESAFGLVEVIGTAFEVRREGSADQITLVRGRVDVERLAAPSERRALQPGQTVEVTRSALSSPRTVDSARTVAWMEGWLSFRDRTFGEIVDRLRAYREGRIVLLGSGVAHVRVSGDYRLDQADVALRSLAAAAGATLIDLPGGIALLR